MTDKKLEEQLTDELRRIVGGLDEIGERLEQISLEPDKGSRFRRELRDLRRRAILMQSEIDGLLIPRHEDVIDAYVDSDSRNIVVASLANLIYGDLPRDPLIRVHHQAESLSLQ